MPPISFTISSLSLGFTAFSELAWWKVKRFAGASSNRKLFNKEIVASIRSLILIAIISRSILEAVSREILKRIS